jgi:hypothetical protein
MTKIRKNLSMSLRTLTKKRNKRNFLVRTTKRTMKRNKTKTSLKKRRKKMDVPLNISNAKTLCSDGVARF